MLKPRFNSYVFCKTSALHRLSSDFLHGVFSWGDLAVIPPWLAVLTAFARGVQRRTGHLDQDEPIPTPVFPFVPKDVVAKGAVA